MATPSTLAGVGGGRIGAAGEPEKGEEEVQGGRAPLRERMHSTCIYI